MSLKAPVILEFDPAKHGRRTPGSTEPLHPLDAPSGADATTQEATYFVAAQPDSCTKGSGGSDMLGSAAEMPGWRPRRASLSEAGGRQRTVRPISAATVRVWSAGGATLLKHRLASIVALVAA